MPLKGCPDITGVGASTIAEVDGTSMHIAWESAAITNPCSLHASFGGSCLYSRWMGVSAIRFRFEIRPASNSMGGVRIYSTTLILKMVFERQVRQLGEASGIPLPLVR